jgi:hypothetical protein
MRARWLAVGIALLAAGCGGGGAERETRAPPPPKGQLSVPTDEWRTDFSKHTVPLSEFVSGGPGKDGIPAIDNPSFAPVDAVTFLRPREPVIQLAVGREIRAYPIQILVWHEIVNDRVGGVPVVVTFCPLCNTALAFDRRVDRRTLSFGVSGNLRNNDLVMYDRETESWWQQFGGVGVVGRYSGTRLRQLPAHIVAWSEFARRHPGGQVLARPRADPSSVERDFLRPYGQNPYAGYDSVDSPPLVPIAEDDDRLPPKERVVFIERGGDAVAVPLSALAGQTEIRVEAGGDELLVRRRGSVTSPLDAPLTEAGRPVATAEVVDERGRPVPFDQPFWFAVAAFRPDVEIVQ